MDILEIANNAVSDDSYERVIPPAIDGRHLQLDADIPAYYFADVDKPIIDNFQDLKEYIETQRLMVGAEVVNLHLTMGDKGGRDDIAMVTPYQDSRKKNRDEAKQIQVKGLRQLMSEYETDTVKPFAWFDQEADDGLTQFQIERIKSHGLQSTVIMTIDKDLDMSPGIHIHPESFDEYEVPDGYGRLWLDESTLQKKCRGIGTSFLWAQMLMGDSADTIPGLPGVSAAFLNKNFPTKGILNAKTPAARDKLLAKRKDGLCGAVRAFEILEHARTDMQAFKLVKEAYESYYGKRPFQYTCWRGDEHTFTAGHMMLEQARLLWMRRTRGEDVLIFFKEVADGKT